MPILQEADGQSEGTAAGHWIQDKKCEEPMTPWVCSALFIFGGILCLFAGVATGDSDFRLWIWIAAVMYFGAALASVGGNKLVTEEQDEYPRES